MIALILFMCFLLEIEVHAKSYNLPEPIDLTHTINENTTMTWNISTPFRITKHVAKNWTSELFYSANDFCTPEHAGTHLDAPYHFAEKGMKVAEIPLDTLIGPGVIVNVSDLVKKNGSDFLLRSEHLITWEKDNGAIPTNATVLIDFGWSWRYGNRSLYFGSEHPPFSFPGISKDAAEWIVKSGKIRGIGVDTPSIDYGQSSTFDVHSMVFKAGLFGLENVNLSNKTLPAKGFDLIVLPMKLGGGSGAPVRVVAV